LSDLDIDALLAPLAEDSPCGGDLEYDAAFIELEKVAKGVPEQQVGSRIEPAQPPNWKEVRKIALGLCERTRDLRVMLVLTEAQFRLTGLSGLRDGLTLLAGAVDRFWDGVHPRLDPNDNNDPTQRVNILMALCDGDKFVRPLAGVALLSSRALGELSLRSYLVATSKLAPGEGDAAAGDFTRINAIVADCGEEVLRSGRECVKQAIGMLDHLEQRLSDLVGIGNASSFEPLRDVLKETQQFFLRYCPEPQPEDAEGEDGDEIEGGKAGRKGSVGSINSREDVIRVLDLICDYYARNEPSSPLPLLIKRARRLVPMDFLSILKDLAPSGVSEAERIRGAADEE